MRGSVTQPFTVYLTKGEDLFPAGGDHVGPSLQKLRQLCQERGVQEYLNQKFAKKIVQDLCQGMFVVDLSRISSVIADTTPRLSASQLRSGETEASSTFTFQISFLNFYFSIFI